MTKEWITGRNPVFETLRANRRQPFQLLLAQGIEEKERIGEILRLAAARKQDRLPIPIQRVPRQQLDRLSESHQGVALEVGSYPYSDLSEILAKARQQESVPFILILDILQNPQNLGVLLRTAEACGVHGVLIPKHQAVGVTPAVVQSSAGASEHLLVAAVNLAQTIETLKKENVWVIGVELDDRAVDIQKARLDGAVAIVIGGEGEGMRQLTRRSCDLLIKLPMQGEINSLNAAAAGSIVLYFTMQTRKQASPTQASRT